MYFFMVFLCVFISVGDALIFNMKLLYRVLLLISIGSQIISNLGANASIWEYKSIYLSFDYMLIFFGVLLHMRLSKYL